MNGAIEAFRAAGEPTRFRALRILIDADKELCACEIIDVLGKPQYTISKSLGVLVSAGLVEERREGRMMMYELLRSPINEGIFEAIRGVPTEKRADGELARDHERLLARLAQRKDGKYIPGC